MAKGNFPSFIPKTDQDRIQNIWNRQEEEIKGHLYEVTEKLHGCSLTVYLNEENKMGVCSRNLELKPEEGNTYWKVATKYKLEEALLRMQALTGNRMAIQGEICGPGINGNQYDFDEHNLFVFDIYDISEQEYVTPLEREYLLDQTNLPVVPLLFWSEQIHHDLERLLTSADGPSVVGDCAREGLVFKAHDADFSFKIVSNQWLLKGGE